MVSDDSAVVISVGPFVEAFVVLIALPLVLAVATAAGAKGSRIVEGWNNVWAWMPVPAMAAVLVVVIGSQISTVVRDMDKLLPVIPVYIGFMLLAPVVGALVGLRSAPQWSSGPLRSVRADDERAHGGGGHRIRELHHRWLRAGVPPTPGRRVHPCGGCRSVQAVLVHAS